MFFEFFIVKYHCIITSNCGFGFYICKCRTASFTQKNLFGYLQKFFPQAPIIFPDTPKSFGQKDFKPDSKTGMELRDLNRVLCA